MKALHHFKKNVFFLLVIVLISCSDNDDNSINKNLIGTWSWVSSSGGIAGITETPASTGKNIDLKFTNDGKYFYYTNGILSSEGTYKFSTLKSIADGTNKNSIVFSADGERIIDKIDNTNLYLSDNYFDGFGSSYIKKQ